MRSVVQKGEGLLGSLGYELGVGTCLVGTVVKDASEGGNDVPERLQLRARRVLELAVLDVVPGTAVLRYDLLPEPREDSLRVRPVRSL